MYHTLNMIAATKYSRFTPRMMENASDTAIMSATTTHRLMTMVMPAPAIASWLPIVFAHQVENALACLHTNSGGHREQRPQERNA